QKPIKWYVVRSSKYVLFDTDGYDPIDGTPKKEVTADICRAYDQQRAGIEFRPLSYSDALDVGPNGVWYYRGGDKLYLFGAQIPIPSTKELTQVATPAIFAEIRRHIEEDKRLAEEEKQRIAAAEAERQAKLDQEAAK